MYIKSLSWKDYLDMAKLYADKISGCNKVAVGAVIVKNDRVISLGSNKTIPCLCKTSVGCLRKEKYGEDSKSHRNPDDCRAIHSEIDAICNAAASGTPISDSYIFITRYPCENCAKAIIDAGIKRVFYGGTTRVNEQTEDMFDAYNVGCTYIPDWKEDTSDR
nr:MAG TPA: deoxycytidylate deaminase [Caudoviricetes sp.]